MTTLLADAFSGSGLLEGRALTTAPAGWSSWYNASWPTAGEYLTHNVAGGTTDTSALESIHLAVVAPAVVNTARDVNGYPDFNFALAGGALHHGFVFTAVFKVDDASLAMTAATLNIVIAAHCQRALAEPTATLSITPSTGGNINEDIYCTGDVDTSAATTRTAPAYTTGSSITLALAYDEGAGMFHTYLDGALVASVASGGAASGIRSIVGGLSALYVDVYGPPHCGVSLDSVAVTGPFYTPTYTPNTPSTTVFTKNFSALGTPTPLSLDGESYTATGAFTGVFIPAPEIESATTGGHAYLGLGYAAWEGYGHPGFYADSSSAPYTVGDTGVVIEGVLVTPSPYGGTDETSSIEVRDIFGRTFGVVMLQYGDLYFYDNTGEIGTRLIDPPLDGTTVTCALRIYPTHAEFLIDNVQKLSIALAFTLEAIAYVGFDTAAHGCFTGQGFSSVTMRTVGTPLFWTDFVKSYELP